MLVSWVSFAAFSAGAVATLHCRGEVSHLSQFTEIDPKWTVRACSACRRLREEALDLSRLTSMAPSQALRFP